MTYDVTVILSELVARAYMHATMGAIVGAVGLMLIISAPLRYRVELAQKDKESNHYNKSHAHDISTIMILAGGLFLVVGLIVAMNHFTRAASPETLLLRM